MGCCLTDPTGFWDTSLMNPTVCLGGYSILWSLLLFEVYCFTLVVPANVWACTLELSAQVA
jgi:hypothetical protein